jgi:hypothetical protein
MSTPKIQAALESLENGQIRQAKTQAKRLSLVQILADLLDMGISERVAIARAKFLKDKISFNQLCFIENKYKAAA